MGLVVARLVCGKEVLHDDARVLEQGAEHCLVAVRQHRERVAARRDRHEYIPRLVPRAQAVSGSHERLPLRNARVEGKAT
jgi:hypothetical protein